MVSGGYVLNLVIEGGMKCRGFFLRPRSYSSGQVSAPGSLFQDEEMRGMLQFLPQRVELSPHAVGEEGGDIRAGEIVALPTHLCGAGHIVAIAGFVERHTHVFGEGERPFALNALANQLMQCRKRHVYILRNRECRGHAPSQYQLAQHTTTYASPTTDTQLSTHI